MGSGYGSVGRAVASNTRVHGSNPVIDEFLHTLEHLFTYCQLYWKDEIKEKRQWMAHCLKKH